MRQPWTRVGVWSATRRIRRPGPWACVGLVLALLCPPACSGERPVVLLAASSLAELASGIAVDQGRALGTPVQLRLGASSTLARQLRQGLAADVFLSASREWADAAGGLEARPWLGNRLAWVLRRDGPQPEPGQADSLVLGQQAVPVGAYAEQALARLGLALPPRVVRGADARDTLRKLAEGAADAAVVYLTDARAEPRVMVARVLEPEAPIRARYVAVLLSERGRPLFEALFSAGVMQRAATLGFEPAP